MRFIGAISGLYRGYEKILGLLEKKMETTIMG